MLITINPSLKVVSISHVGHRHDPKYDVSIHHLYNLLLINKQTSNINRLAILAIGNIFAVHGHKYD
jgi:hypothetical protein